MKPACKRGFLVIADRHMGNEIVVKPRTMVKMRTPISVEVFNGLTTVGCTRCVVSGVVIESETKEDAIVPNVCVDDAKKIEEENEKKRNHLIDVVHKLQALDKLKQ